MRQWLQHYAPIWTPIQAERSLKRLIWLYVVLWLAEGALRKWTLPQLSTPLLVVRDPVAVLIIVNAVGQGVWRFNWWTLSLLAMSIFAMVIAFAIGTPWLVVLFGLRTMFLHFPLIFIMGRVLNREDVARLGNLFLDLSLPIAILMALQFAAGPDAYISKGVGAALGGQLEAGGGRIRAPGVFSFVTGAVQFYGLVAAFLFSRMTWQRQWTKQAVLLPAAGLILAASVSVSRSLVSEAIIVAGAFGLISLRLGLPPRRMAVFAFIVFFGTTLISVIPVIKEGQLALVDRWLSAGDDLTAFFERGLGSYWVSGDTLAAAGPTGSGLGMGTNAAGYVLTGEQNFLLAEDEWQRVVLELGAPLGLAFIVWRIGLTFAIARTSWRSLKAKDPLALLLLAAGITFLLVGQISQPTTQGFVIISMGLVLAACNYSHENALPMERTPGLPQSSFVRRKGWMGNGRWGDPLAPEDG